MPPLMLGDIIPSQSVAIMDFIGRLDMILTVNNPKTGWAHAVDLQVANVTEAMAIIKDGKNRKVQYSLEVDGKLYWYNRSKDWFYRVSNDEALVI